MNPIPRNTALALLLFTLAATTIPLRSQPASPPPAAQSEPSGKGPRLAQRVHRVQSVINQTESVAPHRDDTPIQKDIEFALHADAAISGFDVKVNISFSRATLAGRVSSSGLKTLAGRVAAAPNPDIRS